MRVLYSMLLWDDLCVDMIAELVPFGGDGAAGSTRLLRPCRPEMQVRKTRVRIKLRRI